MGGNGGDCSGQRTVEDLCKGLMCHEAQRGYVTTGNSISSNNIINFSVCHLYKTACGHIEKSTQGDYKFMR